MSISPIKEDIFITINLIEGERYTISDVKLAGEMLGIEPELRELLTAKPGETFNNEQMTAISKRVLASPRLRSV